MRACNLYRLDYPDDNLTNICQELDSCDESDRTSIWNEYIVTPMKILKVEKISMAPFFTTIFNETDLDLQGSVLTIVFRGFRGETGEVLKTICENEKEICQ